MPLPLYGSGGRIDRIWAATCPTCCLSAPLIWIFVVPSAFMSMPGGAGNATGWEKPNAKFRVRPCICARYPTPCISRLRVKPRVTPLTMFAMSVRVRPCNSRLRFWSSGRATVTTEPSTITVIGSAQASLSSPFGPLTVTSRSATATATPLGTSTGIFPILLISLPYEGHHFAAAIHATRLLAAHDALGRRQDHQAQTAHTLRNITFRRIDAQARAADALQTIDHALAMIAVLERQADLVARFSGHHFKALDEALCLEQLGDLFFQLRRRNIHTLVMRDVRIANARQHVGDGVGHIGHS